jgi:hypothetical protein
LFIDICALAILIFALIRFFHFELSRRIRRFVGWGSLAAIILFFASYGFLLDTCDYVFFRLREKQLNEFVVEIRKYKKIHEMSDGLRHWKSINDHFVEFNRHEIDTTMHQYFVDDILQSEHIDKDIYENFRQRLINADLVSFSVETDGAISFLIEGFLDSSTGLTYSETGTIPRGNYRGGITHWVHVGYNWYVYYSG